MILRQVATRHGRSVIAHSSKCMQRCYATEISNENQMHKQSERDSRPGPRIPGHPDEASSILDTTGQPPTLRSRVVAETLEAASQAAKTLQAEINAYSAGSHSGVVPPKKFNAQKTGLAAPFNSLKDMYSVRKHQRRKEGVGSKMEDAYRPWDIVENPPTAADITLPMLLANQTHLGHATSLWNPANSSYIFGIREGIHIISLEITLAYLRRAARVVQEVARRGGVILFVGTRKGHQGLVVNAAKLARGYHIFSRWVPGALTNGQQILGSCAIKVVGLKDQEIESYRTSLANSAHPSLRPDLVICLNPIENEVCLHECGLYNVPTIGIIDTDSNPSWVTYPIPANDDSLRSVALVAGALGRAAEEGQRLRMQMAEEGQASYSTDNVRQLLSNIEEISSLDVTEPTNATAEK